MLFGLILSVTTITNAADLSAAVMNFATNVPFRMTGTVTTPCLTDRNIFFFSDQSGHAQLLNRSANQTLNVGDVIVTSGCTEMSSLGYPHPSCYEVAVVSRTTPPPPVNATVREIKRGDFDFCLVRVCGTVTEAFKDEIDSEWQYIVLTSDGDFLYIPVSIGKQDYIMHPLVGAEIAATGACSLFTCGHRQWLGRSVVLADKSDIQILKPAPHDPFDAPLFDSDQRMNPENLLKIKRCRLSGLTLATWQGDMVLIREGRGKLHNIKLATGPLPDVGQWIEAAGQPKTDLFQINLYNAVWRATDSRPTPVPEPCVISIRDLFQDKSGRRIVNPRFHGRSIRLTGTIQETPPSGSAYAVITMTDGNFTVPVDVSSCPNVLGQLSVGCRIDVTGVCTVDAECWRSYSAFPHMTGVTLIVRSPRDILVVSRPSWWTPVRLMSAIGFLLAAIAVIFVWNRILSHLVEKRSRQLLRTEVGRVSSELRIEERTRLAVELHDSISQNLTGTSLQIDAAEHLIPQNSAQALEHLEIAARTVTSCHEELRNCIWDLRSQALELPNMNEAILKALHQHAEGVKLQVRFNVPRARLSDHTAHALMRIIRELVTNAIRHGHATQIKIAGALEEGTLRFSVTDNGCGFDPESCPGIVQGHFGLQGIRERIKSMQGEFVIENSSSGGIRARLSIPIQKGKVHEQD